MTNKKIIPVFFSVDDAYMPFLAVSLESLEKNANKNYNYQIKILNCNSIKEENKQKIITDYHKDCFNIEFVDISPYIENFNEKLHTRDYYSKSTYYRLFIPNIYKEYDKALYLDADITICGDVSELYFNDLQDNYVGAITDQAVMCVPQFIEYVNKKIKIKDAKNYFNAGILLMNLKKLREINFENIFIEVLQNVKFQVAQDQDYLNYICKGHVKYLHAGWNKMPCCQNDMAKDEIKLVHYNLSYKPWQLDNIMHEELFWKYAQMTRYYEKIKQIKANHSEEDKKRTETVTFNLINLAHEEANQEFENARIEKIINDIKVKYIGANDGKQQHRKIAGQN